MANNIFRMQGDDPQQNSGLDNKIRNWGDSKKYDKNCIDIISDDNTSSIESPTSIPSPFARIALAKTAFTEVAKGNTNNVYRQIVSDCLDLAELCFDFNKWERYFNIVKWNPTIDLNVLPDSNPLKSTLRLFLESDKEEFHFDKMKNHNSSIYILTLKTGEAIGATSPCTVFFSPENNYFDIDGAPEILLSNGHKAFQRIDTATDNSYTGTPLSERDWDFVKYFYNFCYFVGIDKCVKEYLENQKSNFSPDERTEINNIQAQSSITEYANYLNIEILGARYSCRSVEDIHIESDFMLDGKQVIVIPNGGIIYIGAKSIYNLTQHQVWNEDKFGGKYFDRSAINERKLPTNDRFSCLYISDFLADTIVRMPYKLNSQSFFNGNYESEDESFLLPLKERFFDFFTIEELQKNVKGSKKKMFEFVDDSYGIKVILRIPLINNNYIEYSRLYAIPEQSDLSKNVGVLIEKHFGMGIMPFVKFPENVTAKEYRVALFDKGDYDIQLASYNGTHENSVNPPVVRRKKNNQLNLCSIESYRIDDNFNRIKIKVGDVAGILVPLFKDNTTGSNHFTFAVDFGTTNTHIEYNESTAGNLPTDSNPFDITNNDRQLHRLHRNYRIAGDDDINAAFVHNFIPDIISTSDSDYSFPMRTALAEQEGINYNMPTIPIAHGNVPFPYEKDDMPAYNNIRTELKWDDIRPVKLYLESIFIQLRNKVVLNKGDLIQTKVIWSYPVSMGVGRYNRFQKIWDDLFEKYFGDVSIVNGVKTVKNSGNMKAISESTAPYHYYSSEHGATDHTVTVDVGGGTTDVYVFERENSEKLLSFRFASNAVFGDGFGYNSNNNGFVKKYYSKFIDVMKTNGLGQLVIALGAVEKRKKSSDIISFMFSLANNKMELPNKSKIKDIDALNFLQILEEDEKMKYVFILFYGAILYYVAKIMKAEGFMQPLKLGFSGNGARSLRILSPQNTAISNFAQMIFNGVYSERGNNPLGIIFGSEPKIATSKGSINFCTQGRSEPPEDIRDKILTILGNDLEATSLLDKSYQEIIGDETVKSEIVKQVIDFIEFLFATNKANNNFFVNNLAADANISTAVKEFCQNETNLMQSLNAALNKVIKDAQKDAVANNTTFQPIPVEETLFFYPLIGVLHDLALKISNNEL